jgi:hypothetical protein
MRPLNDRGVKIFSLTCAGSLATWKTGADMHSHSSINNINFKQTKSNGKVRGHVPEP